MITRPSPLDRDTEGT